MIRAIVACEAGFWVLLVGGLLARYALRARRLSVVLLASVPLVDVALLAFSVIDLRRGGTASTAHGLAAVYLGVSIAFGHQMIRWADEHAAHRFAGGPPPARPPRTGPAYAARQRRQWLRHLLAYTIALLVLAVFTLLVGDIGRTLPLWAPMAPWGVAVVIDLLVTVGDHLRVSGERTE